MRRFAYVTAAGGYGCTGMGKMVAGKNGQQTEINLYLRVPFLLEPGSGLFIASVSWSFLC